MTVLSSFKLAAAAPSALLVCDIGSCGFVDDALITTWPESCAMMLQMQSKGQLVVSVCVYESHYVNS